MRITVRDICENIPFIPFGVALLFIFILSLPFILLGEIYDRIKDKTVFNTEWLRKGQR